MKVAEAVVMLPQRRSTNSRKAALNRSLRVSRTDCKPDEKHNSKSGLLKKRYPVNKLRSESRL